MTGDAAHEPLIDLQSSDEELERAVVEGLDTVLHRAQREHFPAGTTILEEGEATTRVWIVEEGRVELHRATPSGPALVHAATTGRIIGLGFLSARPRAFFTCRAATDVRAIPLTYEQLDAALQADPTLSRSFMNLLLRSLARRHQRSVELQLENEALSLSLRRERDELARALAGLEEAQARLIQAEKMATLGEMAAGIAHELNNPAAAISRATAHVTNDATALVEAASHGAWLRHALQSALDRGPESTAMQRRRRRLLAEVVADERLARRLDAAGIHEPEEAARFLAAVPARERDELLELLRHAEALGSGLRNIDSAAERIAGLVRSLRSYARDGDHPPEPVDVREGLEDTLRLLQHRLENVQVHRHYGDVPSVPARAGELNQLWTNLIVNALDAMGDAGTLAVHVEDLDGEAVQVQIADDGPGIEPEILPRLFEPHFTTKGGRVEYGLGLGLAISRQIVNAHGGTIDVRSSPGNTVFTVELPARPQQRESADGRKETG